MSNRPSFANIVSRSRGVRFVRYSAAYNWFIIEKGDVESKKHLRSCVWTREGDETYFVCPSCFGTNKIDISAHVIRGYDLDTVSCNVCSRCMVHLFFTLVGWTLRKVRGAIKHRPDKCPLCGSPACSGGGLGSMMRYCRCKRSASGYIIYWDTNEAYYK